MDYSHLVGEQSATELNLFDWAKWNKRGAEILLLRMDNGTKGTDLPVTL
jgi:hypothetical protein